MKKFIGWKFIQDNPKLFGIMIKDLVKLRNV